MLTSIGRRLGQYYLSRLLGQGGFADVYEAYDCYLRRRVAIKVLHTRLTQDNKRAFLKEARTLARLNHPHIVKVIEFNVHGNTPYLVMNLASNGTLRQRHPLGEQLSLDTIMEYLWQISDALTYIHKSGLVHRDIKPENLLLGENGEILLNDFGIAKSLQNANSQPDQPCKGTVYYLAPERLDGISSPATDQYALAVLIYSWLTGDYPFDGSSQEIIWQHIHAIPHPLRALRPDTPVAVEQVVLKALEKDPEDRFESVQEFVLALDQARYAPFSSNKPEPVLEPGLDEQYMAWNKMSLIFTGDIFLSLLLGSSFYVAGIGLNMALFIARLCLLILPLPSAFKWRNRLAMKIAIGVLAVAMMLGLTFNSWSAFWWTAPILLFVCSWIGHICSWIGFLRGPR